MPTRIANSIIREVTPLRASDPVGTAVARVLESGLPALPAVEEDGRFAGIFGEREFLAALFPGWIDTMGSAAMIRRSIDEQIERREECREQPIDKYLTRDHVLVADDYADTQIAEIFLHHRVLIVPIATDGRVHAVVTRADFFRALAERFADAAEDVGD
jgi:CBS-domain-containing membrane protein